MDMEDLLESILYLAPGFVALEFYRYIYPAKFRNQFTQISWSLITGFFIYVILLLLDRKFFGNSVVTDNEGFPTIWYVLFIPPVGFLFGCILVLVHYSRVKIAGWFKWSDFIAPDSLSTWATINKSWNRDWAVVYLRDGSIYLGGISSYTYDPNSKDQDFLLGNALRVDEDLQRKYNVDGAGVYLNTKDVIRIEFVKGMEEPSSGIDSD